jgi:glutamate synthase domain-containing protein 2
VTVESPGATPGGVTLISPPPHHGIYSIEDGQLVYDLRQTTRAPSSGQAGGSVGRRHHRGRRRQAEADII